MWNENIDYESCYPGGTQNENKYTQEKAQVKPLIILNGYSVVVKCTDAGIRELESKLSHSLTMNYSASIFDHQAPQL